MSHNIKQIPNKYTFLLTIEILSNEWEYKIGDKIKVVVIAENYTDSINTFTKIHAGSEYPNYKILTSENIGDWLFYNLIKNEIIE